MACHSHNLLCHLIYVYLRGRRELREGRIEVGGKEKKELEKSSQGNTALSQEASHSPHVASNHTHKC